MSLSVFTGILAGYFGILALKAVSANYLYVLVILLSVGITYGTMWVIQNINDNKFKLPTGRVLFAILLSSAIVGLLSGLITIRLLYI
jgi:hypothetical protein